MIEDKKVCLDINGTHKVTVGLNTLTKVCPNSKLAYFFSSPEEFELDENGAIFIDRDGETFTKVIDYLRQGVMREEPIYSSEA